MRECEIKTTKVVNPKTISPDFLFNCIRISHSKNNSTKKSMIPYTQFIVQF